MNREILASLRTLVEGLESRTSPVLEHSATPPVVSSPPKVRLPSVKPEPAPTSTRDGLSSSEQKILDALASLEAVGVEMSSKTQFPHSPGIPTRRAAALVRKGMVESSAGRASMTPAGRDAANLPSRPATTRELQERIFSLLGEGERKLLTLLIAAHPGSLKRVELAQKGGYSNAKSGGFAAPLARLIELGFVDAVENGVVRGSEMLFLKGEGRRR